MTLLLINCCVYFISNQIKKKKNTFYSGNKTYNFIDNKLLAQKKKVIDCFFVYRLLSFYNIYK